METMDGKETEKQEGREMTTRQIHRCSSNRDNVNRDSSSRHKWVMSCNVSTQTYIAYQSVCRVSVHDVNSKWEYNSTTERGNISPNSEGRSAVLR